MNPSTYTIGWTLVHFLWQGAAVAVITATALRLCGQSASRRYVTACAGLVLMLACPVVTLGFLSSSRTVQEAAALDGVESAALSLPRQSPRNAVPASRGLTPDVSVRGRIEAAMPALVWAWIGGVAFLLVRFTGGCWRVHMIVEASIPSPPSVWQAAGDRLAGRLGLGAQVRVRDSASVATPTLIGWMRPMIILPAAALANLTPQQVEAVLAHELAHVRRHDYVVNLAQTLAEVLLFYHPAVWWVSARIRDEREHCCDDVAIALCGEPVAYVEALTELEAWRSREVALTLAATGGSLLGRARRLLHAPADPEPRALTGVLSVAAGLPALAGVMMLGGAAPSAGDRAIEEARPSAAASAYQAGNAEAALPPGEWRVRRTEHFDVYHAPELDLHAERVAQDAERAYASSSAALKHDLAFKVPILLFGSSSELTGSAADLHVGALAEPSRGRIVFATDRPTSEWAGAIAHEVAHVFGFDIVPGATTPQWLMEGLAEYQRAFWDVPDLVALRDAVRRQGLPGIAALTAGDSAVDPKLASGLGHAAFEFVESRWGKEGVRQFLFALRRAALNGTEPYEQAFGLTPPRFEIAFGDYLQERFGR